VSLIRYVTVTWLWSVLRVMRGLISVVRCSLLIVVQCAPFDD